MSENLTMITERVDDIPLLLTQLDKMSIAELLHKHFPTHGNWQGLSLGDVACVWLRFILSEADHRMNHVEPWAVTCLPMRQLCMDHSVRREDFTDDRLASVLDYLSTDEHWHAFEGELNQRTLRVYDLQRQRVRLDATTAKGYVEVSEEGLFPFGVSKEHRPDLPHIKINLSVLEPLGRPLTTTVLSGERADDPLYIPEIKRVQHSLKTTGMTYIGDCKMGSLETRAHVVATHDDYLCPLSGVQMPAQTFCQLLTPVLQGTQPVTAVYRPPESPDHKPELIAEGFEDSVALTAEGDGKPVQWMERRLVVRSIRYAQAEESGLRTRVYKAREGIEALNQRGRGKKRFTEEAALRGACQKILEKYCVEGLIALEFSTHTRRRILRRYKNRPQTVQVERDVRVRAHLDEEALETHIKTLGWRVYATNQPAEQLALEQAVLAYRQQFVIEHPFGRLKNKPLSLTPMYLSSDARVKGLVRLLSIGLRVLTVVEFVARRMLRQEGAKLAGIYAGNPKRATAQPTTEMMLQAFKELTLTPIQHGKHMQAHVTPLSKVQQRILTLIGLSPDLYVGLALHFSKPKLKMSER